MSKAATRSLSSSSAGRGRTRTRRARGRRSVTGGTRSPFFHLLHSARGRTASRTRPRAPRRRRASLCPRRRRQRRTCSPRHTFTRPARRAPSAQNSVYRPSRAPSRVHRSSRPAARRARPKSRSPFSARCGRSNPYLRHLPSLSRPSGHHFPRSPPRSRQPAPSSSRQRHRRSARQPYQHRPPTYCARRSEVRRTR